MAKPRFARKRWGAFDPPKATTKTVWIVQVCYDHKICDENPVFIHFSEKGAIDRLVWLIEQGLETVWRPGVREAIVAALEVADLKTALELFEENGDHLFKIAMREVQVSE